MALGLRRGREFVEFGDFIAQIAGFLLFLLGFGRLFLAH